MKKLHEGLYHGRDAILAGPDGIYKECHNLTGELLTVPNAFVITKVGNKLFVCNDTRFMERVDTLTIMNFYKLICQI